MLTLIITFVFFHSVFLYFDSNQPDKLNYKSIIFGFCLFFLIIGLATFNNDWLTYEDRFVNNNSSDLLYFLFYRIFNNLGLKFEDLYLFNQILNGVLIINFTRLTKTSKGATIVILISLIIFGATLSILLRYSTAFLFFINGIAYYYLKDRTKAIFFLSMAVMAHFGAIVLIFLYFSLNRFNNYVTNIFKLLIIAFLLMLVQGSVFQVFTLFSFGNFLYYIEEQSSSLQGGIMASLPILLWFFVLYIFKKYIVKKGKREFSDFFYFFSMIPFILIFIGLSLQIVLYRYIEPFSVVWGGYITYELQFLKRRQRFHAILFIFIVVLLTLYLKYFLPFSLIGNSEWYEHYNEILESNKLELFK